MKKKKLRPLGCSRTISGRHIPEIRTIGYEKVEVYCGACGKIDDTGVMCKYLFGDPKDQPKIDDSNIL